LKLPFRCKRLILGDLHSKQVINVESIGIFKLLN
jgi:hypothetical protein